MPNVVPPPPERRIFCNRTLNLRAIQAIGYDMDYTLVHYKVESWEQHAFTHMKERLAERGWPVHALTFDGQMMVRGLIIDTELGNILKVNRFGYIKQAMHGTRALAFESLRQVYALTLVNLADPRFVFVNTLFSVSEISMYAQLVDLYDDHTLSDVSGYADLYRQVGKTLNEAHLEGQLKAGILADPHRFINVDPETALTLLDQREAGKRLLLITNSDWAYTRQVMHVVFDSLLPKPMTWRDLFELVIVSANKPDFFSTRSPMFEIVDDAGLLKPVVGGLKRGGAYLGGNAALVEQYLNLAGEQILYVGDHIFVDVHVSKNLLHWRTALVMRELEQEMVSVANFAPNQRRLTSLMQKKQRAESKYYQLRLQLQRKERNYGPAISTSTDVLQQRLRTLKAELVALDEQISPLAQEAAHLSNARWGLPMRTGNDKSLLAKQIERYADIYMSRVSNFLLVTPYGYLRAPRGTLPHDALPEEAPPSHQGDDLTPPVQE